jgi:hypothetical protein
VAEGSKLEFRDVHASDEEGPYLTRSNHDVALEQQVKAEAPTGDLAVNPNPFGSDEYVGTDPIYQNSSTDANRPFSAEDGAEKEAEEHLRELHSLDDEDEDQVAEDYGLGGKARLATQGGPEVARYLVPGQEGYDKEKAESQLGPPMRVEESEQSKDDKDSPTRVADNRGMNLGSTVQAPPGVESPEKTDAGVGDKPADEAGSKGSDDSSSKSRRSRS